MNSLFNILPSNFFNPLTSPQKSIYAECVLKIYDLFTAEHSYGIDKEIAVQTLVDYFDSIKEEVIFEEDDILDENISRKRALHVLNYLCSCGWIEFEPEKNFTFSVVLTEFSIPFIRTIREITKNEETEYQGLISQIYATLNNEELYRRPFEQILQPIFFATDELVSELKKLEVSIKHHIDKLTKELTVNEILDRFGKYQDEIVSKPLMRLKTSDNVSKFRSSIKNRLDQMLENEEIFQRTVLGFMETKNEQNQIIATNEISNMINDVRIKISNLDAIISKIEQKDKFYTNNALSRASFLLNSDASQEGKIKQILKFISESENSNNPTKIINLEKCFNLSPQRYISNESLKKIITRKTFEKMEEIAPLTISEEEKRKILEEELILQKNRIVQHKIEKYVLELLESKNKIKASDIPIESIRDFSKLIYIRIYGEDSRKYRVEKLSDIIATQKHSFNNFMIIKQ